jgi:hypothetical protein
MRVEIILDPKDHRDIAMRDEINGWLHHAPRGAWTMTETEADDEGLTTLTYGFRDCLDAHDLLYRHGVLGRGRLA